MKLEFNNRPDSRGFHLRVRPIFTLAVHGWSLPRWRRLPLVGWRVALQLGRGAGYITRLGPLSFSGRTAFVGWRTKGSRPGVGKYIERLFCCGVTNNANTVPYGFRA